jgi:CelD/BcsL family acetyltransferase involved in cellulose biosynthesis
MLAGAQAAGGLTVEWRGQADALDALAREWADLVERDPEASLFQTPEWLITWWRHVGAGRLRVLTVRRGGRLVALVPMAERRERVCGVPAQVLALLGEPEADRLGLLADPDPDAALAAASAVVGAARSVDVLRLAEVPVGSRADEALRLITDTRGTAASRRVCARAPVLALDRPWRTIEAGYSRTLRTRLGQARRRQRKAGGLDFRRWQPEPTEVPALLASFREVERRSWKGARSAGIFADEGHWRFFLDLSRRLAQRGWLDVATLSTGDRLVAYRYGFRFREPFLDYNLAHDPADARLSPGRVLLDEVVRDSHRLGLVAVDASRGSLEPAHLLADWTPFSRWHARWTIFGPHARARALALAERRLKPVWRCLRLRALRGERESA